MKKMRKWTIIAALSGPVLFAGSCATGLREALIEGGFAFVEESVVHALETFIPIDTLIGGATASTTTASASH